MNPVKITDTTFRDAHQSLMATRFRTADMKPIAADMDAVGFHSMEVWGGATFDVATRFLGEDPWERLRTLKQLMPNTPAQMLLRGQALVGYRSYSDDVVDAFVKRSAEAGIDIFRVFDALNDEKNLARAAAAVKKSAKHLQMTICYSITDEGRLGGPIYNLDYYITKAKLFESMEADSICIKDMAGLLAPYDAYELCTALKSVLNVPLQLHTHYTSGMASMSCMKAIEAGIDVVDTCLSPLALRTSQPAIEPLLMTLRNTDRDPSLNLAPIIKMGDYLESVLPKYSHHMETPNTAVIDARVLSHQIPGGMISNLISQLKEANSLDKLPEVLGEIPNTRKDLGYPPLVTPTSQMIGSQAVSNVLFGRYKMVSSAIKDYVYGLYGRPPAAPDPEVVKTVLKGYERGETPTFDRPGDVIEPELDQAKDAVNDISADMDDVLTYALYPTTGMKFLRIKYGLDPVPEEMEPAVSRELSNNSPDLAITENVSLLNSIPPKSARSRAFNVFVGEKVYRVEVDPLQPVGTASPIQVTPKRQASLPSPVSEDVETASPPTTTDIEKVLPVPQTTNDITLEAPMPGIVLRYTVKVGQRVNAGDTLVVLEAMKMENSLPSPVTGTVKSLPLQQGATVGTGEPLVVVQL